MAEVRRLAGISGVESHNQIRAHLKIFSIDPVWTRMYDGEAPGVPSLQIQMMGYMTNFTCMFNPNTYWFDEVDIYVPS